jgi:hypothetical protein
MGFPQAVVKEIIMTQSVNTLQDIKLYYRQG